MTPNVKEIIERLNNPKKESQTKKSPNNSANSHNTVEYNLKPSEIFNKMNKETYGTNLEITDDIEDFVESCNQFSFKLFNTEESNQNNSCLSPFSAYIALSMLYIGAEGTTLESFKNTLDIKQNPSKHKESALSLLVSLIADKKTEGYDLNIANLIAIKNTYPILEEYKKSIVQYFKGEIMSAEYLNTIVGSINSWVAEKTNWLIKEIITSLPPDIKFILLNAVYFKGDWKEQFLKSQTKEEDFTKIDGSKSKVMLMYEFKNHNYFENDDFQLLEMLYSGNGGRMSMVIILPKKNDNFLNIKASLNYNLIKRSLVLTGKRDVECYIPKFKIKKKYKLYSSIYNLGLSIAFSEEAKFGGITNHPQGLKIGEIIQKTFIEVDEKGTEAAAVTLLTIPPVSGPPPKREPPVIFRADHPFIYLIRDNFTKSILFIGQFMG